MLLISFQNESPQPLENNQACKGYDPSQSERSQSSMLLVIRCGIGVVNLGAMSPCGAKALGHVFNDPSLPHATLVIKATRPTTVEQRRSK